jgi:anti-sigma factor RsiW
MGDEQRDELLSAYLDGELPADVRIRLEERCTVDPQLRAELAALRQTVRLLHQMRPMPVPRNFILPETVAGVQPAQRARSRLAWAAPWLTAATAAVSLLFVLVLAGGVLFAVSSPAAMAPAILGERDMSAPELGAQSVETVQVEKESETLSTEAPMAAEAPAPEATTRADEGAVAGANTRVPATAEEGAAAEQPEMPMEPAPEQEKAAGEEMASSAVAPSPEVDTAPPSAAEQPPDDARSGEPAAAPEGPPSTGPGAPSGEEGLAAGQDGRATWALYRRPVNLWLGLGIFLGLATVALIVTTVMAWRARRRQS